MEWVWQEREILTFSLCNTSILFELLQEACIIFLLFSILPKVYKLTSENNNNFLQFYSFKRKQKENSVCDGSYAP